MASKKRDLRALVLVRVLYQWSLDHEDPPRQVDLGVAIAEGEKPDSLITQEIKRLGIPDVYGVQHVPQFQTLVDALRDCRLMVPAKKKTKKERRTETDNPRTHWPTSYELSEAGVELAQRLDDNWRSWPALADLCD